MNHHARLRIKGTNLYLDEMMPRPKASVPTSGYGPVPPAYDAGAGGRRARGWWPTSAGPNAVLQYALPQLRNRSRDARRQNGVADAALATTVENAIGTGIQPVFDTPDDGLNRELGELFLDWTDEADADGALDFYGQQALALTAMLEAGDCFTRLRQRRTGDMDTVPLQLQVLEADYVPEERNEFRAGGATVQQGIILDAIGRRTGYLMYRRHPQDWTAGLASDAGIPVEVPASEVLHLRQPRRPGQLRGEPILTRALIKLRDADQYDDAELMRQKIAALFAGFVRQPLDDGADGSTGAGGTLAGQGAPDADGAALAPLEAGTLQMLEPGEEITFSDPPDSSGYPDFMRQQWLSVAVATRGLYETVSGDYSKINDRMWRAAVHDFRRRIEMLQHHIVVYQFCRPVIRRWLMTAELARAIRRPRGMSDRDFMRVRWAPQRWPHIHPVQDVQSAVLERNAGFRSTSSIIAERGERRDQVYAEMAAEEAQERELGLVFPARQPKGGSASSSDEGGQDGGADRNGA